MSKHPAKNDWRRMNKAASKHRRAHWHAERAAASTPSYTIEDCDGGCCVLDGAARVGGPFVTNSEAWRWIDQHTVARRYGAD